MLGCSAGEVSANSRYDPSLHFRSLTTQHFVIHFHQGEERLAVRLSGIVEQVHSTLTAKLALVPRGRTHVVLVDQSDQATGWATPTPRNTIELSAVWPHTTDAIGNTDDWLALVFAHEYAHILHLGRSEAWAAGVRRLFGSVPFAFPNLYLPQWQIEGLATYEESRVTGRGRLFAGDFSMLVDEAARARSFEPIDRVNGGLVDWPSGAAGYAYGAFFHQYLADRFGEARFGDLARRTAGQLPYTGGRAFTRVFGESLGTLWRGFTMQHEESMRETGSAARPVPRRLTHHGFVVVGPRFLDPSTSRGTSGTTAGQLRVVYSARNPRGFPSLLSVGLDGSPSIRIADRFGGDRVAATGDAIYFDQLELKANVALMSDLYGLDRATGRVDRLTRAARLSDPDVSPTGDTLACVVVHADRRDLAEFDLSRRQIRMVASQPDAQFSAPRWSPDGRLIAAARQSLGGASEIVLVNAQSGDIRVIASMARARHVTPAWTPDGQTVLFAADRDGRFNLYAVDLDGGLGTPGASGARTWQVTRLTGGATSPDISPDGGTIVYVGYTPEGFDLFTIPFDRSTWDSVDEPAAAAGARGPSSESLTFDGPADPVGAPSTYRPFRTLRPYYWLPRIETDDNAIRCGVSTGGVDVLSRHGYTLSAAWPVCGRSDPGRPKRPDWSVTYVYNRWRPVLFAAASGEMSSVFVSGASEASASRRVWRERRGFAAGISIPFRQVHFSHSWLSAVNYERDTFVEGDAHARHRPALRFGWTFSNAQEYGYSISPERGLTASVTTERVHRALGAPGNASAVTAQIRGYLPAGSPHAVLALRTGAATSWGDPRVRRVFELGGDGPSEALPDFGGGPLSLMRGFPRGAFSGRRLVLLNLDYRVPLTRPERGYSILPVFLRTFYGSIFLDAGHVWDQRFSGRDLKTSAGLELSCDLVAGYSFPLTATAGVAWGRDGRTRTDRITPFVRIGRAF